MSLARVLIIGFWLGTALGCAYFTGLWLTVRRLQGSANPLRLTRLSRLLRQLAALALMIAAARYDATLLGGMLPGFLFGRILVSRRVVQPLRGVRHASQS